MPDRGSCWVVGLFILLIGGVIASVGLYFSARQAMVSRVRKEMTPDEYLEMNQWLDAKVDFPPDWANPDPYSMELKQTADRIRPAVEYWLKPENKEKLRTAKHPLIEKFANGEALTEEERSEIENLRAEARPIVDGVSAFTAVKDYEFEALALFDYDHESYPLSQNVDGYLAIFIARRLALEASVYAHRGDWDEAFDQVFSILDFVRRHPASDTLTHIVAAKIEIVACHALGDLVWVCSDMDALRSLEEEMRDLESGYPVQFLDAPFTLDLISFLRKAKRLGMPVNLESGRPNAFYLGQFAQLFLNQEDDATGQSAGGRGFLSGLVPIEYIYQQSKPTSLGVDSVLLTAETSIRLTKLGVATRINKLSGTVNDLADQSLKPLLESSEDPFLGKPFLWDASSELFYSVGPDEKDDGNLIQYSPTNGAVSMGDYSLK